jgi:hypothetical protein
MIKQTTLGRYHNSPPLEVLYYREEDFNSFCLVYSSTLDFLYDGPLNNINKPTIYFDTTFMEVYYPDVDKRVKYEIVSKEEREEIGL